MDFETRRTPEDVQNVLDYYGGSLDNSGEPDEAPEEESAVTLPTPEEEEQSGGQKGRPQAVTQLEQAFFDLQTALFTAGCEGKTNEKQQIEQQQKSCGQEEQRMNFNYMQKRDTEQRPEDQR